jgi:hypothetical protein
MAEVAAATEFATAFVALNEVVRLEPDLDANLQRLAELAVTFVPGAHSAAVTEWPSGTAPSRLASSDRTADEIRRLQYELGEGPGLTAALGPELVRVANLPAEDRWPRLARRALGTPVRSVLSGQIAVGPSATSLTLYSRTHDAFGAEPLALFGLFVAHARVLVQHAVAAESASRLEHALHSSRQIATAVGVLMSTNDINESAAAGLLRLASRYLNRKVVDVAVEVIETGDLPADPGAVVDPRPQFSRSTEPSAAPVRSARSAPPMGRSRPGSGPAIDPARPG